MKHSYRATLIAFLMCTTSPTSIGATVSLPLAADAWINGAKASNNFGAATALTVHNFGPKFTLVRFDASSIAGATVTQATLRLFPRTIGASGQLSVYPLVSSWAEGTVTWALQPPSESTATANVALTTAMAGTVISINVTSVVQRWANGSLPDAGFLLSTLNGINAAIDSKERAGGTRAALEVITQDGPPPSESIPAVVLNLSHYPVVIDDPGLYVLDRNWTIQFSESAADIISIKAPGVTLDLRGHTLSTTLAEVTRPIVVYPIADGVTIKNGTIDVAENGQILVVDGDGVSIENVNAFSTISGVVIRGSSAEITNSDLGAIIVEASGIGAQIKNNLVTCLDRNCITIAADNVNIVGNRIFADPDFGFAAVQVGGNHSVIAKNLLATGDEGLVVFGNNHLVSDNILETYLGGIAIQVNGTSNIIRGNVGIGRKRGGDPLGHWSTGIRFSQSGNFYGNNQMSATVPFALNGTTQVDWGGNFGF